MELDASEYSPEDDSSSVGGDQPDATTLPALRETENIIAGGNKRVFIYLNSCRTYGGNLTFWQIKKTNCLKKYRVSQKLQLLIIFYKT